jgi:hypothetical protein
MGSFSVHSLVYSPAPNSGIHLETDVSIEGMKRIGRNFAAFI